MWGHIITSKIDIINDFLSVISLLSIANTLNSHRDHETDPIVI